MQYDKVIKSKSKIFELNLKVIREYKDLIFLFIKRDFITYYKQTILGPLWYLISPVFSTITYMIVFGTLANLGTNGIPQSLFYFSGTMLWTFFSENLTSVSGTFRENKNIFGKVYFPRLVSPIASVAGRVIKLMIQFILFLIVYIFYIMKGAQIKVTWMVLLLPVVILWIGILSMGFGMIIASITTKYRDLALALNFLLSLFMYVTPVVYPYSEMPDSYKFVLWINPLSAPMEFFRTCYFGTPMVSAQMTITSIAVTILSLVFGMLVFEHIEKTFVDVI